MQRLFSGNIDISSLLINQINIFYNSWSSGYRNRIIKIPSNFRTNKFVIITKICQSNVLYWTESEAAGADGLASFLRLLDGWRR